MDISYIEMIGYLGSALTLTAVCMKTMIPLRFFAMCSNLALIFYAYQLNLPSILIMQCILFPLNGFRLYQMRKLVRGVKKAASGDLSVDWLVPYMSPVKGDKGTVLCRRGEEAQSLFYIQEGLVRIEEFEAYRGSGDVIGEIGLFAPDGTRTATVICEEDCKILKISADKVYELYYQNPDFGFYMIRIVTDRLIRDMRHFEEKHLAATS